MTPKRQETAKGGKMTPKRQETAKGGKMTPKRQETFDRRENNAQTDKPAAFQIFPEKEKVSPQDCGIRARKSLLFFRFFVILLKRLNFGGLRKENYGKRRIYG